jgi:hypothetical protein
MDSDPSKEKTMLSIGKRVAGISAAVALIVGAGPVALAGAATTPSFGPGPAAVPAGPVSGAYQAGLAAAIGGLNAGADAAAGGWSAGAAALGLPFSFSTYPTGSLGLRTPGLSIPGVSPLIPLH